ncbi:LysR family transcriptional regulator [Algicella marina]|nr:LysR family transcriptional regulator [Algicella marina]
MNASALPSLSALRAFEATARLGSLSAAGRELNVTHAAVSQQVRALEQRLEEKLVERQGRGVALTETGAQLAAALSRGFDTIRDGWQEVAGRSADRPVSVTMTPAFATHWFMPRYPDFLRREPDANLIIRPSAEVLDPDRERFDVAIRFGKGGWPGLEATMFLPTRFVVVGAPGLVPPDAASAPDTLSHLKWFQETGTDEIRNWMDAQGFSPALRANISDLPGFLMLSALREGYGVAATARLFVEEDIAAGRLEVVWEAPETESGYHIVHRPGVLRPQVRRFVTWLKRQAPPDQA